MARNWNPYSSFDESGPYLTEGLWQHDPVEWRPVRSRRRMRAGILYALRYLQRHYYAEGGTIPQYRPTEEMIRMGKHSGPNSDDKKNPKTGKHEKGK